MAAKDFDRAFKEKSALSSNGYLLCRNCRGYYHLEDGEQPEDFESCECGSPLEYHENLPNMPNKTYNDSEGLDDVYEDYIEIEQLLTLLKDKSKKRKEVIKSLANRIQIQEGLLNEIKEERWNLWDVLNERHLQSDIRNQKRLLDDIAENEDRLLSIIKEQRERAHYSEGNILNSYISRIGARGFLILEFVIIVVLLLLLLLGG